MKILQIHSFYQQPGGEDQVLAAERDLLAENGHQVEQYTLHNDVIKQMSRISIGLRTIWNPETYRTVRERLSRMRPDLVHAHNTFPLISPALYYAAEAEKVPVVQTLHNFRLVCPAATLYRDGHVCEQCLHRAVPYPAMVHGCYRGNRLASSAISSMLSIHRIAGTWTSKVQTYLSPSNFLRTKLIEGGLPAAKIVTKPNFLAADPGVGSGTGGFALFLGRLAPEKGIGTLLSAWESLTGFPLKIAGDGPLRELVLESAARRPHITWSGHCGRAEVFQLLKAAALLIVPSEWYEVLPLTVIEAMACGTPVLASDIGSLKELVIPEVNGLRFAPGSAVDLTLKANSLLANSALLQKLRTQSRRRYEDLYTADRNLRLLTKVYDDTIRSHQGVTSGNEPAVA